MFAPIFPLHVFYFHPHILFDCECVACTYAISTLYPMGIDICNSNAYTVKTMQSDTFVSEGGLEFVSLFSQSILCYHFLIPIFSFTSVTGETIGQQICVMGSCTRWSHTECWQVISISMFCITNICDTVLVPNFVRLTIRTISKTTRLVMVMIAHES